MALPLKIGKPCFGPSFADPRESFFIILEDEVSVGVSLPNETQKSDEVHTDDMYEIFSSEIEDRNEKIRVVEEDKNEKSLKRRGEADHAKANDSDEYTTEGDNGSGLGGISDESFIGNMLESNLSRCVSDSIQKCAKAGEGDDEEECLYFGYINPTCGAHSTSATSGQNCICQIVEHCLVHTNSVAKGITDDANMAQLVDEEKHVDSNRQFDEDNQNGEEDPASSEAKGRLMSRLDGPYWIKKKLDLPPYDPDRRMSPRVKTPTRFMRDDCGGEETSEVEKKKKTVKKLNFTQK